MLKKLLAIGLAILLMIQTIFAIEILKVPDDEWEKWLKIACDEFNASSPVNKDGKLITIVPEQIDETIFRNYGLLTITGTYDPSKVDFALPETGATIEVPRTLGMTPTWIPATNPIFRPDSLKYDVDHHSFVGNKNKDTKIMQKNDRIGSQIPRVLPFNSNGIILSSDEIYMGLAEGLADNFPVNLSTRYEKQLQDARNAYAVSNDPKAYRQVKLYDTALGHEIGFEDAAVITALPTEYGYGRALVFHTNGDWYYGITIPPKSMTRSNELTLTGHIDAPNSVDSSLPTVNAALDFVITATEELASYEITSTNTNIDLTTPIIQTISGKKHVASIPFVINMPSGVNPVTVEFKVKATDTKGNTKEIPLSKDIYLNYNVVFTGSGSSVIKADHRDSELFDVTKGIPTSEKLYVNVFGDEYLHSESFMNTSSFKTYSVEASKTYNLSWQEQDPKKKNGLINQNL